MASNRPAKTEYRGRELATAQLTRRFSFGDEEVSLSTDIQVFEYSRWGGCAKEFKAKFQMKPAEQTNTDTEPEYVGYIFGFTIDKNMTTESGGAPAWISEMLSRPENYKRSMLRKHNGSDEDQLHDVQKVLQLLLDSDSDSGDVRSKYKQFAEMLQGNAIHYIDFFRIQHHYWGSGLARVCMKSYLDLISSMSNACCFEGPVLLSPAPIQSVYDEMEIAYRGNDHEVPTHLHVEEKLIQSYERDGFELMRKGAERYLGAGITIMGQKIVRRLSLPIAAPEKKQKSKEVKQSELRSTADTTKDVASAQPPSRLLVPSQTAMSSVTSKLNGISLTNPTTQPREKKRKPTFEEDVQFNPYFNSSQIRFLVEIDSSGNKRAVYMPDRTHYDLMKKAMGRDRREVQPSDVQKLTGATRHTPFRIVKPCHRRKEMRKIQSKGAVVIGKMVEGLKGWQKVVVRGGEKK